MLSNQLKVRDVGLSHFLGQKEWTVSFRPDSNEPAREDHGLEARGPAVLTVVEEKGLHGLTGGVQLCDASFLKSKRRAPGRNVTSGTVPRSLPVGLSTIAFPIYVCIPVSEAGLGNSVSYQGINIMQPLGAGLGITVTELFPDTRGPNHP